MDYKKVYEEWLNMQNRLNDLQIGLKTFGYLIYRMSSLKCKFNCIVTQLE